MVTWPFLPRILPLVNVLTSSWSVMASAVISRHALAKHLRPVVTMSPSVPMASPCVGVAPALVNLGSVLMLQPIL
jgi:hypothetical protein